VPLRGAALLDATGILITVTGAALALAGLACMERLVPRSPGDDPVALMAALVAGLLRSGLPLRAALAACLQRPPAELSAPARRAGRLVNLGASWSQALAACGDGALAELGVVGRRAQVSGMPIADALERWAERRRREALAAFEAELSRAPVLMVIPLTLLVLPSFVLLGVAPFLRSL
jgi:tight adherence protein B